MNKRPSPPDPPFKRVPITLRIVLGLAGSIFAGTLLLMLPIMTTGTPLTAMQAFFTATSALTVTGLSLINAGTDLSLIGQITLLLLIQFGGVGYMFAAALTLRLIGRRLSLIDRLALSSSLGLNSPQAIQQLLKRVFYGILLIEGSGMLLLFMHWRLNDIVPADRLFLFALFHAISAFCNAGFDLFSAVSPHGIPQDGVTLLIMGGLIITGGLGIPVLTEFIGRPQRGKMRRLTLHTRLTLAMVVALTLFGWLAILLPEMNNGTLAELPFPQQVIRAWFQSVSTRTAGFAVLPDFASMWPETSLVMIMLMFVGSAPASMGGGITTGTFAVMVLGLWGYARGLPAAQVGDRTISPETVRRAAAILTISIVLVITATWILLTAHDLTFSQALFEVVSAFATCGLSLGVTGSLNTLGQLVIIVMMFWGRLGALTIVMAIAQRGAGHKQLISYPEEPVLIG